MLDWGRASPRTEFPALSFVRMHPLVIGTHVVSREPVFLSGADRMRHLYVVGQTGTGKSNTLVELARQDLEGGEGVAFIDPHGETAEHLLRLIPPSRIADVILIDPTDSERPVGFNPLHEPDPALRARRADDITSAFRHLFSDSWGPRLEHFLRSACRTLLDHPQGDLLAIPILFLNQKYRARALHYVTDPVNRFFWEVEFPSYGERILAEGLSPIFNKVSQAVSSPAIRNIFGQPTSTFDLVRSMNAGKILIVKASKGQIGEAQARLLGALMVSSICQAALSRGTHERPFHLYVDEFHSFATDSFSLILSEARKYGLSLTLAHQFLEQLPQPLSSAVFGNCGSFLSFRVGARDAEAVASHLGLNNPDELLDLQNFRAIGRFLHAGMPSDPQRLYTDKAPDGSTRIADKARRHSRVRATRARDKVEGRIARVLAIPEEPKKKKGRSW